MNDVHTHDAKLTTPSVPVSVDGAYTCPMHPQVRKEGPGNCPICKHLALAMVETTFA
ncbi:heavy metal-binding domain-containing protein [Paraburkholderia humisilvae]|uniref:heavy metal-binding domain-containing protein n=1 Tax=Paraburkholderia humisilvae TaxID=627669 RepID=UPI0035F0489E